MSKVLVIAPHPDDEILGCGGTLLKHSEEGEEIGWLIASSMQIEHGWDKKQIDEREIEIIKIAERLRISTDHIYNLRLPALKLDTLPKLEIVHKFSEAFKHFEPEIIYLPHRGDAHSDHTVVFDAAVACTKWFRYPYVKRVLAYETLSETEFGFKPNQNFQPNVFIDISLYFQKSLSLLVFIIPNCMNFLSQGVLKLWKPYQNIEVQMQALLMLNHFN